MGAASIGSASEASKWECQRCRRRMKRGTDLHAAEIEVVAARAHTRKLEHLRAQLDRRVAQEDFDAVDGDASRLRLRRRVAQQLLTQFFFAPMVTSPC